MGSSRRVLAALVIVALPAGVTAQGLGDASKKEQARRKAEPAAKATTYTDADVKGLAPAASAASAPAGPGAGAAAAGDGSGRSGLDGGRGPAPAGRAAVALTARPGERAPRGRARGARHARLADARPRVRVPGRERPHRDRLRRAAAGDDRPREGRLRRGAECRRRPARGSPPRERPARLAALMSARRSFLAAAAALPLAPALAHARQPNAAGRGRRARPGSPEAELQPLLVQRARCAAARSRSSARSRPAPSWASTRSTRPATTSPATPLPPADVYVNAVKRLAFRCGLAHQRHRRAQRLHACPTQRSAWPTSSTCGRWLAVASRLGAPCLRVFDGRGEAAGPAARADDRLGGRGVPLVRASSARPRRGPRRLSRTTTNC